MGESGYLCVGPRVRGLGLGQGSRVKVRARVRVRLTVTVTFRADRWRGGVRTAQVNTEARSAVPDCGAIFECDVCEALIRNCAATKPLQIQYK